jgi:hypothetical protein
MVLEFPEKEFREGTIGRTAIGRTTEGWARWRFESTESAKKFIKATRKWVI